MPNDRETLDEIARSYIEPMTSIRGRRVHRLLVREFARFDEVLRTRTQDGAPALFAISQKGGAAICRTDGRGAAAEIATWSRLQGATVTTAYDLLKDSLPIVGWTIEHPSFAGVAGTLAISATELSPARQAAVAAILHTLGADEARLADSP